MPWSHSFKALQALVDLRLCLQKPNIVGHCHPRSSSSLSGGKTWVVGVGEPDEALLGLVDKLEMGAYSSGLVVDGDGGASLSDG